MKEMKQMKLLELKRGFVSFLPPDFIGFMSSCWNSIDSVKTK
jgi:hypothetical protein